MNHLFYMLYLQRYYLWQNIDHATPKKMVNIEDDVSPLFSRLHLRVLDLFASMAGSSVIPRLINIYNHRHKPFLKYREKIIRGRLRQTHLFGF